MARKAGVTKYVKQAVAAKQTANQKSVKGVNTMNGVSHKHVMNGTKNC